MTHTKMTFRQNRETNKKQLQKKNILFSICEYHIYIYIADLQPHCPCAHVNPHNKHKCVFNFNFKSSYSLFFLFVCLLVVRICINLWNGLWQSNLPYGFLLLPRNNNTQHIMHAISKNGKNCLLSSYPSSCITMTRKKTSGFDMQHMLEWHWATNQQSTNQIMETQRICIHLLDFPFFHSQL